MNILYYKCISLVYTPYNANVYITLDQRAK